jgi:1,4-dihydroxy-2-naphthoate polyprenyltransferase
MSPRFRLPARRSGIAATEEPESGSDAEIEPLDGSDATWAAASSSHAVASSESAGTREPEPPDAQVYDLEPSTAPEPEPGPELEPDGRMATVADGIALLAAYKHAVLSWVAEDGYPMNVDVEIDVKTAEGTVRFAEPPGFRIPPGVEVAIAGSHVHPLPEGGFDERSHVTVSGPASARPRGRFAVSPNYVWVWGAHDLPLAASYARRLGQARRYYEADSVARGLYSRPRLSGRVAIFRAAHAPFLRATLVPILLGVAVAIRAGVVDLLTALIALSIAGALHLGLNIANGLFDLLHGPGEDGRDSARGGSGREGGIGRALGGIKALPPETMASFGLAAVLALLLPLLRGSRELILVAIAGIVLVVAYRTAPLKLADRGLGELAVAIGFGPVLLIGTYVLQSRGAITAEAIVLSVPIGLFAGLIVLVDEIPKRAADSRAGKKTLPVRWSKAVTIRCFEIAAGGAFAAVAIGVLAGSLPIPVLLAFAAIPRARRVRADLVRLYGRPYDLAGVVAANVQLQMNVGLFLGGGYLIAIADQMLLQRAPFLH